MAAAQQLYEKYGSLVDPYLTLVGYFNSMRELGGMRRAVDDAVRTRLRKADERGLAKRFIEHWGVEELTSRKNAGDIPQILDRLETSFSEPGKGRKRPAGQTYPLDVLLATNMISVGVDVSRLGLMVVAGQPKTTAEYIQATSRVGRRFPGLVCVVYNWTRPRDLSHYERFEHYHATFYQHVEPLSVTPFSPRARQRGLSGVLVSYVRLAGEAFNDNQGAGRITDSHPFVQAALHEISKRAGLIEGKAAVEAEVRQELEERLDEWLAQAQRPAPARLGYKPERDSLTLPLLYAPEERDWDDFTCLNSLRDVEPNVGLILDNYGMDPELSVIVMGLEDWPNQPEVSPEIVEDRLLAAIRSKIGQQVARFRAPPATSEGGWPMHPFDEVTLTGVPVATFPRWMVCPSCRLLAPLDAGLFILKWDRYRPNRAYYIHENCNKANKPTVVPARFLVACEEGHLDDFPWIQFVHHNEAPCAAPLLRLFEQGPSGEARDLTVKCEGCDKQRRLAEAFGRKNREKMPICHGRRPHLRDYDEHGCERHMRPFVLGASNAWFPLVFSSIAIPSATARLDQLVEEQWATLQNVTSLEEVPLHLVTALAAEIEQMGVDNWSYARNQVVQAVPQPNLRVQIGQLLDT